MACTCKYAGLKTIENMEFSLDFVHAFNLLIKITWSKLVLHQSASTYFPNFLFKNEM